MTNAEDSISAALARATVVVDVRSPDEFAKGAIAGAVNLPLFSNNERAEIGTLYKAMGKEKAVQRGLGVMGEKLGEFVAAFTPYKAERLLVYCARGGMRSATVVGLLRGLGFDVVQLSGGYKAFRNHLLLQLESHLPPRLIVLHGQTGVGKTLLLRRLGNFLDLEDAAQHRSSVFGAMNRTPRTQQQFEAHLLAALEGLDYSQPVWVEGESRKIGSVLMPDALRRRMQASPCVLVTAPLAVRVGRIVAEYSQDNPATRQEAEAALLSIARLLGAERTQTLVRLVRSGEFGLVAADLLQHYYDPLYAHSMRGYSYELTLSSEDLDATVETLEAFALELGKQTVKRDLPGRKNTQVPVHRQDVFAGIQCQPAPYRDGFLPDAGKPLGNLSLPEQYKHLLLNHPK